MSHFSKPKLTASTKKKKNIPEGLWTKCPVSDEIVFTKDLEANLMVVPKSGYHFPIGCRARIASMIDDGTFEEHDANVKSADPLKFVDSASYTDRIKRYEKDSGLPEAVMYTTIVDWVEAYVPNQIGEGKYLPHITVGVAKVIRGFSIPPYGKEGGSTRMS